MMENTSHVDEDLPMDLEALFRQINNEEEVPAAGEYVETVECSEDGQIQLVHQISGSDGLLDHGNVRMVRVAQDTQQQPEKGLLLFPDQNNPNNEISAQMGELVTNVNEPELQAPAMGTHINVTIPANSVPTVVMGETGQPQLVIPVAVPSIGTIYLPVVPTMLDDGRVEMRITGNPIFEGQSQPQNAPGIQVPPAIDLSASLQTDDASNNVVVIGETKTEAVFDFEEDHNEHIHCIPLETTRFDKKQKYTFKCDECDYTNPRRYLLVRHKKSHSDFRPHCCTVCGAKFKSLNSLQNHYNTHTGLKPFICQNCTMRFTTSGEMIRHNRYKHTLEKPHKCPDCDYATVELSKLKRHMMSHTGERPFQCPDPHCGYTSSDQPKLRRHMRIHSGEKPYECDQCLQRFSQSNSLKAHKLTHSEDRPLFKCTMCPTTCGRRADLRLHVKNMHTASRPINCSKCDKHFTDRYTYGLHRKTHKGQRCFPCPHCEYAADNKRRLEQHVLVHSEHRSFLCDEEGCSASFRQKPQLMRHKRIHCGEYEVPLEKRFTCDKCAEQFRYKANLERHINNAHQPDNASAQSMNKLAEKQRMKRLEAARKQKAIKFYYQPSKLTVKGKKRKLKKHPMMTDITRVTKRGRPSGRNVVKFAISIEDECEPPRNIETIVDDVIVSYRNDRKVYKADGLEMEGDDDIDVTFCDLQYESADEHERQKNNTFNEDDVNDSFGFEAIAKKMETTHESNSSI